MLKRCSTLVWFLILVCDLLFHIEMKNLLSPRLRCLCFLNIYFVWDGRVGVRGTCWCAYAWLPFPLAALWGWVCMHWNLFLLHFDSKVVTLVSLESFLLSGSYQNEFNDFSLNFD